jgi:tripeptide aminopeptidase
MKSLKKDNAPMYSINPEVNHCYKKMLANPAVKTALAFLEQDHDQRIKELIEMVKIPSSPFGEGERASDYLRRLEELGLEYTGLDEAGNAAGLLKGHGDGRKIVIGAHLDTVFPKGYDTSVRVDENGIIHAPGISDDGAGLSVVLSLVRALKHSGIKTAKDLLFVGTVGEEGLGDLRGSKNLFKTVPDIDGFISVDGDDPGPIIYLALGSKRFEFVFKGPGGHSFLDYGRVPSPVHAMGRAIAKIAEMNPPADPKTTFTVSVVNGGTSVNSIASEVMMQTDTRSTCPIQLNKTVSQLVNCVRTAVIEENAALQIPWDSTDNITLEIKLIGDRPSGFCEPDAVHVQAAYAAAEVLGIEPKLDEPASTDASIPINLGVPAVTLGAGGKGRGIHSLAESYDPTGSHLAIQRVFLTLLGMAGISGELDPLLVKSADYSI